MLSGTVGEVELKWEERSAFFAEETGCEIDIARGVGGGRGDGYADDDGALAAAIAADGLIFVLAGDLTATELEFLRRLVKDDSGLGGVPVPLVVVNKRDQWLPEEEQQVLARVQQRLMGVVPAERIVAAAAAPGKIKVRQYQEDGANVEHMEQPAPAIADISTALEAWTQSEAATLRWGAPMRRLYGIFQEVQGELNRVRRVQSMGAIEQSQWIAAAAAISRARC